MQADTAEKGRFSLQHYEVVEGRELFMITLKNLTNDSLTLVVRADNVTSQLQWLRSFEAHAVTSFFFLKSDDKLFSYRSRCVHRNVRLMQRPIKLLRPKLGTRASGSRMLI
jgi:hypothetical protein